MPRHAPVNGVVRWVGVHVPTPLLCLFACAVLVEMALGHLPAMLPWAPDADLRWGLMLPLVTIAALVTMLHSGLGMFERSERTGWRVARAAWCLFLAAVACAPAPFTVDGLETSGSLRNRIVMFSLAVLGSMVLPATLSVLAPAVLMMVSMLAAGASESPSVLGLLLLPDATAAPLTAALGLLVTAVAAYAMGYPPRWAVPGRDENL